MGSHPVNLIIRFIAELFALISAGVWGWNLTDKGFRFAFAIGIPLLLAAVWGTFAVPGDPSRSGNAPVAVPGIIRLVLEFCFFAFAIWTLFDLGKDKLSIAFAIILILHYAISYDRIIWLMKH